MALALFPDAGGFTGAIVGGIIGAVAAAVLGSYLNKKIVPTINPLASDDPVQIQTSIKRLGKGIVILGGLNVVGFPILYVLANYTSVGTYIPPSTTSAWVLNVLIGAVLVFCGLRITKNATVKIAPYFWTTFVLLAALACNQVFVQGNLLSFELFLFLAITNFVPLVRKLKKS